jgi:uncharacterized Zn-binding protein involved in type VI secretion
MSLTANIVAPFAVCRLGDISSGHYPWPARINDTASTDVFVNSLGWHRTGDHWVTHCAPVGGCHDGVLVHGAPGVYINNKPAGRIGDLISCAPHDEFADQGSPDTFCGNNVGSLPLPPLGAVIDPVETVPITVEREDYVQCDRAPFPCEDVDRQIHQI